uniref:Pantothenate kinase 2 n=1 Tax=Plectus sambesii TaxID=2011161 RepID=A0A914XNM5_9BILA
MSSEAAKQPSLLETHQNDDDDVQDLQDGDDLSAIPRRQRFLSLSVPPMPWFGLDIGGTLVKLVYFEPSDQAEFPESAISGEIERVKVIHRYLVTNKAYGETGVRDGHLELSNVHINGRQGTIHFIRFPSCRMPNFISLTKSKGLAYMSSTVCATGGGAHKYADIAQTELNVKLHKFDELESLIQGIEFVAKYNPE